MYLPLGSTLHLLLLAVLGFSNVSLGKSIKYSELSRDHRSNTTAHLIFHSISSLLQLWPNSIRHSGTYIPSLRDMAS